MIFVGEHFSEGYITSKIGPGTTLFLIYINELFDHLKQPSAMKFAVNKTDFTE